MNKFDASRILAIDGELTLKVVKAAYRQAAKKYHPDRNPAGLEMMKLVNDAYDFLKTLNFKEETTVENDQPNYGDELNAALNAILDIKELFIEVCGVWVWVTGDTKAHKETLKGAGYRWAPKKKQWYFKPAGFKSFGRGKASMDDIRAKYGSQQPRYKRQARTAIA